MFAATELQFAVDQALPQNGDIPSRLTFSHGFYFGRQSLDELRPSRRPTSVYQALVSLTEQTWAELARDVFGCDPDVLDADLVLGHILDVDTCTDLTSPVEVWIDRDGFHRVLVFDEPLPPERPSASGDPD